MKHAFDVDKALASSGVTAAISFLTPQQARQVLDLVYTVLRAGSVRTEHPSEYVTSGRLKEWVKSLSGGQAREIAEFIRSKGVQPEEPATRSIGQKYGLLGAGSEFVLASVYPKTAVLINRDTGVIYAIPVRVKDVRRITEAEWHKITADDEARFSLHT